MQSLWQTPGLLDRLTALWTIEHRSASACAAALTAEFEIAVTKNAVLGKLDRLGLIGKGGRYARPERGRVVPHRPATAGVTLPGGRVFRDGTLFEEAQS